MSVDIEYRSETILAKRSKMIQKETFFNSEQTFCKFIFSTSPLQDHLWNTEGPFQLHHGNKDRERVRERERERVGSRVFFPSFVAKVFIAGHNAPVKHMWARRDLLWMERDERGRERETCLKDVALSLSLSLTITHTLSESVFLAQRAHLSVYKLR